MIVAFSCSSPIASVALIGDAGDVLFSEEQASHWNASGTCLSMLQRGLEKTGKSLADSQHFLADWGPGSFIGVRVGVTLAKSFGFAHGVTVGGASSFDLISVTNTVVLPSKKGEFFVRGVGTEPYRSSDLPSGLLIGFGPGVEQSVYPNAAAFASLLESIVYVAPESLMPQYLIEPSISIPKKAFSGQEQRHD